MTSAGLFFEIQPPFDTGKWGKKSNFIVSLNSTSHWGGALILVLRHKDDKHLSAVLAGLDQIILVLLYKDDKHLSIYRNIKSQDEFIVRILRFFIVTLQMLRHAKSFAQRQYVAKADVRPCPYTSLI